MGDFLTNKADWQTKLGIDWNSYCKNSENILNKLSCVKHITDYNGGDEYVYKEFDNEQGDFAEMDLEVRNRKFEWQSFDRGGRIFKRRRVLLPILCDTEQEVFNTMSNPQPQILETIYNKLNEKRNFSLSEAVTKDAVIINNDKTRTTKTYLQDNVGVMDLTTSAFDENVFADVRKRMIARKVVDASSESLGIEMIISQSESSEIIVNEKLSNNNYYSMGDLKSGATRRQILGCYVTEVPGNETTDASTIVKNPMLKEVGAKRNCLALAPNSIAYWESGLEIDILTEEQMKIAGYDKSFGISFGVNFIVERTNGRRCMIIETAK